MPFRATSELFFRFGFLGSQKIHLRAEARDPTLAADCSKNVTTRFEIIFRRFSIQKEKNNN